jgi:hypothetical protein
MAYHVLDRQTMAPTPVVFSDSSALVAAMSTSAVHDDIERFLTAHSVSLADLVHASVSANTFRAFHLKQFGLAPSVEYRQWTTRWIGDLASALFGQDRQVTRQGVRTRVIRGAYELDAHWQTLTGGQQAMGFGRAAKLLGLSVQHLLWYSGASDAQRRTLAAVVDVPLDSYTLQGVRLLLPALRIPKNATLRFVE